MDSVPTWVLLVCLGALGALVMFFLAILRSHMEKDSSVHERVAVVESKVEKLDRELYRQDGVMERLHKHGGHIQNLLTKLFMRDK